MQFFLNGRFASFDYKFDKINLYVAEKCPFLRVFIAYFVLVKKKFEIEFCPGWIQGCNLNGITANLKPFGDHFT